MSVPTGVKEKNGRAVQHSTDVLNGRWKMEDFYYLVYLLLRQKGLQWFRQY
ncbi:MAG TPA: hypothetical protein VFX43_05795 [Chitinophagaceae bacterium]|nr:hypothetical protein [Chitinophagaceae bacterium]